MIKIHFPYLKDKMPLDIASAVLGRGSLSEDLWGRRFNEFFKKAQDYFCSVAPDDADIYVYPYRYELNEETIKSARDAADRGLECFFFTYGDDALVPEIPAGRLYRHSIFSDKRGKNEFAMPAFADDLLDNLPSSIPQSRIAPRQKGCKPIVGFRGYVANPLLRAVFRMLGRSEKAAGLTLRNRVLKNLSSDGCVDTLFERQNQFSGGKKGITHRDPDFAERVRADYIENILFSDYTLCVRGAGNFSYRFYEVLSAGRIPLFVNTKCVLPFEDEIDWRKHCVWIESDDISNISKQLISFHNKISPEVFLQMQVSNRKLWEECLNPLGFYRRLFGKYARKS